MCVDETYVRKLAAEAFEWQRLGIKLPGSAGKAKKRSVHWQDFFVC